MVLHPLEDDNARAGAIIVEDVDFGVQHLEEGANTQRLDLVGDELLDRLVERLLDFTDANRPRRVVRQALLDEELGEEV